MLRKCLTIVAMGIVLSVTGGVYAQGKVTQEQLTAFEKKIDAKLDARFDELKNLFLASNRSSDSRQAQEAPQVLQQISYNQQATALAALSSLALAQSQPTSDDLVNAAKAYIVERNEKAKKAALERELGCILKELLGKADCCHKTCEKSCDTSCSHHSHPCTSATPYVPCDPCPPLSPKYCR